MVAIYSLFLSVTLAAGGDTVLLEYSSPRCQACTAMQPSIDRLTRAGYPVQPINVEEQSDLAARFQVTHIPTCVLLVNGQEAGRLVGMRSHAELVKLFEQATPAQTEEPLVVRGQSPDTPRRGLGLLNRLGGKKQPDAGEPPLEIPPLAGGSNIAADTGAAEEFGTPFDHRSPKPANADRASDNQPIRALEESLSAEELALAATVRLKVADAQGHSVGTGTIIDTLKDEALIVTCGHIFRESKGQGKILVDLNIAGAQGPVEGQLISFDLTRDIALVSIRPGMQVTPVVVCPPRNLAKGDRVFSIGCDHGAQPSVRASQITAVNNYVGSPNYTVAGMPVEGRSGGGLFLTDGSLIGICNAADEQDNEGLYAALPTVHWQLDQIGQTKLYQRSEASVASNPYRENGGAGAIDLAAEEERRTGPPATREIGLPLQPVVSQPTRGEAEYLLVVRSLDGSDSAQVIQLDRNSPELRSLLERANSRRGLPFASRESSQPTTLRSNQPADTTVVRGQSK
jgi:S1-C subfamily serine protease